MDTTTLLAVAGAHLHGEPLNPVLVGLGARLVRATRTAPVYRMVALPARDGGSGRPAVPPRPGLIRCPDEDDRGHPVDVEVYRLPVAGLGRLLVTVEPPLAIGTVELDDGSAVRGFVCECYAAGEAPDISAHGGWRRYLASLDPARSAVTRPV